MTGKDIDDEMLMAYADGELDTPDLARVETALSENPKLVRRLSLFSGTRNALSSAAAVERKEPLPEDVLLRAKAAIAGARHADSETVVPFSRSFRRYPVWQVAIAAGLAALAFFGGYNLSPNGSGAPQGELRFAILDTPGLSATLDRVPSGESRSLGDGEVSFIASFRDAEGALCREFEIDTVDLGTIVSVACRTEDRWSPRMAVVAAIDDGSQYAPASSLETLDAYLTAIGAGAPLSPEQEVEALNGLDR